MTVTIVRERAVLVCPIDKVIASELYIEEIWDTKENICTALVLLLFIDIVVVGYY